MQSLPLPFIQKSEPLTSLSLVSISISPDDRCNNKKLQNLNDIYKNSLFSYSFTSLDNTNIIESRQNSKSSFSSSSSSLDLKSKSKSISKSRSNLNLLLSISPSLKSAYLSKRSTPFRRQRSIPNSFDDYNHNNHSNKNSNLDFSLNSHRSSITSFGSLDCNDNHPLLISNSLISNNSNNKHDINDKHNINNINNNYKFSSMPINNIEDDYYYDDNNNNNDNDNDDDDDDDDDDDNILDDYNLIDDNDIINESLYPLETKSSTNNLKNLSYLLKKLHTSIQLPSISKNALLKLNLNDQIEVPLETFSQKFESLPFYHENININLNSIDSENFYTLHLCGKTRRIREFRINSNYLLTYALDTSIKEKGLFNNISDEEIDIFDDLLLEKYSQLTEFIENPVNDLIFDDVFNWKLHSKLQSFNYNKLIDDDFINNLKLSSIARYKLCSTITLPPRLDDLPNINSLINNIYINPSLNSCHVPWLNIKDLKSGKAINKLTKSAGLLKYSNIQYVSKRCASKRWVCFNNNNNNNNNNN
ncbi:hypothetical protein C6P40_003580 [Pichia californica]|uniref:Uncharacterized protein n=1 Tax=Pichia californica TaxID=460514 RepID=A0A9P6WGG6_9ASCO|nr:hypothetical protein C6P42_003314 [[Candida] californica]KAG0686676.1 hypothetical protein C6P40_003580 [[Candida] californica]